MDVSIESEDEVFFGTMSDKEKQIAARYKGRRTEIYCPGFRENRSSQRTLEDYTFENGEMPQPPNLLDEGVPQVYKLFHSPNSARQRRLYKEVDTAELISPTDLKDSVEASTVETIHHVSPCSTDTSFEENSPSEQMERTFYNLSVQAERGSEIIDESLLTQDSFEIEKNISDEKELKDSFSKSNTEMDEMKPEDWEITGNVAKRSFDEEKAEDLLYLRLSSTDSEAAKLNEGCKTFLDSLEESPCGATENNTELNYLMKMKPQDELSASCCLDSSSSGFKLVCSSVSSESVGISLKMSKSSGQQSKSDKSDVHNETVDEIEENLPRDSLDDSSYFDVSLNKETNIKDNLHEMDSDSKGNEAIDQLCGKSFINSLFKDDLSFTKDISTVGMDLDGEKNESTKMTEGHSINDNLDEPAVSITTDIIKSISDTSFRESDLNKKDCFNMPTENYSQSTQVAQVVAMDISLNDESKSKPFDQGLINSTSEEKLDLDKDEICAGNFENEEFMSDKVQTECDSKVAEFMTENEDIAFFAVVQEDIPEKLDCEDDTSSTSCLNSSSDSHLVCGTLSESSGVPLKDCEKEIISNEIDKGKNNPENDTLDEIEENLSVDNTDKSLKCEIVAFQDMNFVQNEVGEISHKLAEEQSKEIKTEEISISVPSYFITNMKENVVEDKSDLDGNIEMDNIEAEMSPEKSNENCSELNSQGFASSSETSGSSIMITSSELSHLSGLDESTSWVYSKAYSTDMKEEKEDVEQNIDVTVVSEDNLDKENDELCKKFNDYKVNTSNYNSEINKQCDIKIHTAEEKIHLLQENLNSPHVSNLSPLIVLEDLSRESSPKNIVDNSIKTVIKTEESAILENDILVVESVSKDGDLSKAAANDTMTVSSCSSTSYTVDSLDGNAVVNFTDSLSKLREEHSKDNAINTEKEFYFESLDSEKKMEVVDLISDGLNELHLKTEEKQEQPVTDVTDESDFVAIPQTPSKFKFVSFRSGKSSDKKKMQKETAKPAKNSDQPVASNEISSLSNISIASSHYVSEITLPQQEVSTRESNESKINETDKENSEPQPDTAQIPYLPPGKFCYTSTPKTLKNQSGSNLSSTHSTRSVNRNTSGTMKTTGSAQKLILKKVQVPILSAYKKPKLDNIESPVAKYINEFPASPLIKNVKSRTFNKPSSLPTRSKIPTLPKAQKPKCQPTEKGSNISRESLLNNSSKTRTTPKTVAALNSSAPNVSKTKNDSSEPKARRELRSLMQQEKSSRAKDNHPASVLPNKNYTGTTSLSLTPERLEALSEIHRSNKKHKSNLGIATSPQPTIIKHRRVNALQWANELATENAQKSSPKHVTTIVKPVVQQKSFDESSLDVTGDMEVSVMEIQHPSWTKTLTKT